MSTVTLYQIHSIPNDPKELFILINQKVFISIDLLTTKIMHTVLITRDLICIIKYNYYTMYPDPALLYSIHIPSAQNAM